MTQGPTPKLMGPNSPRRTSWAIFHPEEPSKKARTVSRIPRAKRMMAHIWFRRSRSWRASSAEERRGAEVFFFPALFPLEEALGFLAEVVFAADAGFFAAILSPLSVRFDVVM